MAQSPSRSVAVDRGAIGTYIRCMDRLSGIAAAFAGLLLAAGVLSICQMIFMRYVLGQSTTWQTEFTIFSVTAAMLLGSPHVLRTGGHVAITALPDMIGGLLRKAMLLLSSLVGLGFCIALSYGSWIYFLEAYDMAWTTGTVWNPPLWPALLPVAIGSSLLSLQYVAEILRGEA